MMKRFKYWIREKRYTDLPSFRTNLGNGEGVMKVRYSDCLQTATALE
jgi:hypothetical protein